MPAPNRVEVLLLSLGLFGLGLAIGVYGRGSAVDTPQETMLPGDDKVLVRVADSNITAYDHDRAVRAALGEFANSALGVAARKDILESLVTTRAIAHTEEASMAPKRRAALDRKVAAYRDQLLVKSFLKKNAPAKEITAQEIREYYEAHPERFGQKEVRTYELLGTDRSLTPQQRDELLREVKLPEKRSDWNGWAATLKGKGLPVVYRQGSLSDNALHPKLRRLVKSLDEKGTSPLSFIEGRAYVVRATGTRKQTAKPLSQVRAEVSRTLGPRRMKAAVKQVASTVRGQVPIEYVR